MFFGESLEGSKLKEIVWDFLENALKLGPNQVLGIDIGLTGIRMAELNIEKSGVKLNKFHQVPLGEGVLVEDEIQDSKALIDALEDLKLQGNIKLKNVAIGMSGPNSLCKRIQVAGENEEDIFDQITWESEQYIPFGIDDSTVSFHVQGENSGGGNDCLMVAARSDVVDSYCFILKEVGLKVKIVDMQVLALVNLFNLTQGEDYIDDQSSILLLDFGAQKTNFVILCNGRVLFTREISAGGRSITSEIQRSLGLTYEDAEDLKLCSDENGNLPQEVSEIIQNSIETYTSEIHKTLDFFNQTESQIEMAKCFITGGNSLTPGMLEGIQNELNVEVEYFDPLSFMNINQKNIDDEDFEYINSIGTIAMGLGLRRLKR